MLCTHVHHIHQENEKRRVNFFTHTLPMEKERTNVPCMSYTCTVPSSSTTSSSNVLDQPSSTIRPLSHCTTSGACPFYSAGTQTISSTMLATRTYGYARSTTARSSSSHNASRQLGLVMQLQNHLSTNGYTQRSVVAERHLPLWQPAARLTGNILRCLALRRLAGRARFSCRHAPWLSSNMAVDAT